MIFEWKKLLTCSLALFSFWAIKAEAGPQENAQVAELRVGILPYMSTQSLLMRYAPLHDYLERVLHRPVRLLTAPTFANFIERARHHDYDLYVTAPHFAVLAEQQSHYRRVARLQRELDGSFIVRQGAREQSVADLKGKRVGTPDPLAIITLMGEEALRGAGLEIGKTVRVVHFPSHNAAILAVANGQVEAAIVSSPVFESMSSKVRAEVRVLERTQRVPHIMLMASPQLSSAEYESLTTAILNFGDNKEGISYFNDTGYAGFLPIRDSDVGRAQPYADAILTGSHP